MIANSPKPGYPGPHYFVIYVVVATVICGFLNPLSLMFSMAALICMAMVSGKMVMLSLSAITTGQS